MNAVRPVLTVLLAAIVSSQAQDFVAGNLAVVRLGDGSQTLANTGNTIFIDQYTLGGSLVNSVQIVDSGANALVMSGTATAEGFLSRSGDRQYLTFAAYNTPRPYSGSVATSASASVPRAIGMVDISRNQSVPASSSTVSSGQSFRSAVTDGNNNFWGATSGSGTGTYYFGNNTTAAFVQTANTTLRGVNIFGGNLYYSSTGSGGGGPGIFGFVGLPTAAAAPTQIISTGASAGSTDFAFNTGMTLAYIADDRATAAGGIQRWDFNGTSWALTYTLGTGVANIGARGLAVDFSGPNPVIFATTAEGSADRLITITDTGAGSTATTLATSPSGEIFRGLEFAPVPEPSSFALVLLGLAGFVAHRRLRRS